MMSDVGQPQTRGGGIDATDGRKPRAESSPVQAEEVAKSETRRDEGSIRGSTPTVTIACVGSATWMMCPAQASDPTPTRTDV